MKYEKEILAAFKKLGFVPRDGQVNGCNRILVEFIDNKKTDVCLTASTGTGKSVIGVVVPEALHRILGHTEPLKSVIGMHQNSLVQQYADTFEGHDSVMQVKGAANYSCGVMDSTAEHCVSSTLHSMANSNELKTKHCKKCVFNQLKKKRNSVDHLITNYSFLFVDRMLAHILDPRLCYVWDEAHTLNDVFTDHNAIFVSVKRLKDFINDISGTIVGSKLTIELMKLIAKLESNKVIDSNYFEFIETLRNAYLSTKVYFESQMEDCVRRGDFHLFKYNGGMVKKYGNLACKISDLIQYKYPHVFDLNPTVKEFTIKAVFIGKMFDVLRNSKYNLFMSATLTEEFMTTTMGLDPKTTAFIKLDSHFPSENKKVMFVRPMLSLNYQSMQKKETTDAITKAVNLIVKHHAEHKESGIIFVPSFKVCDLICSSLRKSVVKIKIFEHKQGEKAMDVVNQFKNFSGTGVLISPSIFEGIDLPEDISRFQIVTKVPYPSLADKRIKHILDTYPKVYQAVTLHKLVQCLGRSIRSETDHAMSYILDKQGYNLLTGESNIWFDEFSFGYLD